MRLYCLHDREDRGARAVSKSEAADLNRQGWGVFWVLNDFMFGRRAKNLTQINYWFCEIDGGDKEEQAKRVAAAPLLPSFAVESRNGWHLYWKARNATRENWTRIVRWGLVPALGADPRATDPLRLLRAPGYYHHKQEPFMVSVVYQNPDASYTEEQMLKAFPDCAPKRVSSPRAGGDSFWERVAALDGREAIQRLSGHWGCKEERFALREQANGNANIVRRLRGADISTPNWVWADGRIGGCIEGSTIAAWLYWYWNDWRIVAKALREVFPELENCDMSKATCRAEVHE